MGKIVPKKPGKSGDLVKKEKPKDLINRKDKKKDNDLVTKKPQDNSPGKKGLND